MNLGHACDRSTRLPPFHQQRFKGIEQQHALEFGVQGKHLQMLHVLLAARARGCGCGCGCGCGR